MGISYSWRHVPGDWLDSKSPRELRDVLRMREADAAVPPAISVQNSCSLMHYTLTTAAPDNPAAELPLFGGTLLREGEEHPEYGFVGVELFALVPDDVRTAADFLGRAPLERWVLDRRPLLRERAQELLFSTEFNEDWAEYLAESLLELRAYFQEAARDGHAVISYQDA
ncbi:DUF1877 family protein [Yinghuangia seranimata]|uniref:DUF1877 family protein n=1 Tax=Yinghuangia seranimata TaxID=408067 RepID=UPI00248B8B3A|nr:DUF1877 family protein [Yinghuangia seranimata]MDI2127715.1 DUF1877 family protein [Yinghuangia seranimata]